LSDQERTIAGRYQVKHLIGRGGMADVFQGLDTRLGRVVAIKILKADLAADSSFESRFRQEAQASARMAHPTIVRIYDAGEEQLIDANGNGMRRPYIVMEFVKGTVLRDLIHERQLSIVESVSFAQGVLTALEISHRAGVIHRDIKSANIMITESGQVKVMDFGIARAVSDSSVTQAHTGGIVGTAQYFSPEQAKGETVDSRTDLYSTGVLLYEMLTGRPPFRGETAVSVAYQHVSEAVIPPSQLNPKLSPELDAVVLHALAKNRDERFQSAEQFREHLLAALMVSRSFEAEAAPVVEPVLVEPEATSEEFSSVETTAQAQTSAPELEVESAASLEGAIPADSASAATEVFGFDELLNAAVKEAQGATSTGSEHSAPTETYVDQSRNPTTNPFESIGVNFEASVEPEGQRQRKQRPQETVLINGVEMQFDARKPRIKSAAWALGSAFVVLLLGLGIWSVSTLGTIRVAVPTNNLSVKVPDVEGKSFDEIKSAFESLKLLTQKTYEPSDKIAIDDVIRIDPPAGTLVSPNTSITVFLSSGKELVKVPNLIETNEANASAALSALGLKLGVITPQNSPSLAKGTIISSNPEQYAKVSPGTAVDLITSSGKVTVPSVLQQSVTTAKAQLTGPNVSYTVSVETQTFCNGTKGQIVTGQSIEPGDANQHQTIVLYVDCIGGTEPSPTPTVEPGL
jgi:serine/threonine-protein kinase